MLNNLLAIPNKTLLLIFMVVLIVFIVLLTAAGIVFITVLRKRKPVVKVLMSPKEETEQPQPEEKQEPVAEKQPEEVIEEPVAEEPVAEEPEEEVAVAEEPEEEPVAEEVIEEPVPVFVPELVEDEVEEEVAEEEPAEEEEETVVVRSVDEKTGMAIIVRYRKSFMAKLIQSKDETKSYYTYLKNELLSYKKVKSRLGWGQENFNSGRNNIARFTMRGKSLCIYFALNPEDYEGTKYKVIRATSKKYEGIPCLYKIKNARRAKYAAELIAALMEKYGLVKGAEQHENYYKPYETTEQLIEEGLIKELIKEENYNEFVQSHGEPVVEEAVAEEVAATEAVEEVVEEPVAEEVVEEVIEEPVAEEVVEEVIEEQPEEEAVEEPVPVFIPELAEDEAEEEEEEVEEENVPEEEEVVEEIRVDENTGITFVVRYRKSFMAKLIQSKDETKSYYTYLKNELLSYKKVKSRLGWGQENFNSGRNNIARFTMRGKSLCIYFALNPEDYEGTKYKVIRATSKKYEGIPCLYKIKNARRAKYAAELIAALMEKYGLVKGAEQHENYYKPYETTEQLIEEGLIKELIKEENNGAPVVHKIVAEEVAAIEAVEEVVEEPVEEEVVEEIIEEQPEEEVVEEVIEEQPEEEVVEEVIEEPVEEEVVEEVIEEQPEEEVVEEVIEEPVEEEVVEEIVEEPVEEEVVEEVIEEPVEEEVVEEITEAEKEEILQEIAEKHREEVSAEEVNEIINDEVAVSLIEKKQANNAKNNVKSKGGKAIINIDTLSKNFEHGETVNLESLKAKKLIGKNVSYVKVLARGTLTKPLTVEAQYFSIEAVKMILITGGKVIKA